ncbi:hypothetical protein ACGFYP_06090 [Streptomyces sp. NPDC048370]|uniref:hypothetical protein n=1 Tax=Streptomyces sp. NPDC048370 TaxID=3365540 RepID=UPI003716B41D
MTDDRRHAALERSLRDALLVSPAATGDDPVDREGASRALAAFRTARDTGLHASRPTRRRDDWTPSPRRRGSARSLKAALAGLFASVTLGGVAIASGSLPGPFQDSPTPAPALAPEARGSSPVPGPSTAVPQDPSTSGVPGRPDAPTALLDPKEREALCRSFEKREFEKRESGKRESEKRELEKKDGARGSQAWQRLVRAAGGEENVSGYCGPAGGAAPSGRGAGAGGSEKGGQGALRPTAATGSEQPRPAHPLGKTRTAQP